MYLAGCGHPPAFRTTLEPRLPSDCLALDSVLTSGGWGTPITMAGKITVDVKQYRLRGRFDMTADARGNLSFEFAGGAALGGVSEDVVLSCYQDTVRVLDRERAVYYEGAEVDSLILAGTGLGIDVARFVGLVVGRRPACDLFETVSVSPAGRVWYVAGRMDGTIFRAEFDGGRMTKAYWPALFNGRVDDRFLVTYKWDAGADGVIFLDELVIFLEERRWRVKLQKG